MEAEIWLLVRGWQAAPDDRSSSVTLWSDLCIRHFSVVHANIGELPPTMTSVMPTAVRVAVTLLAIAATAGHLAYLDALWWHSLGLTETVARDVNPALILLMTAHALVSIVSAAFAVGLVLHEGPRQDAAQGLGAAFGAWSYLMAYSGVTMLFRPDPGLTRDIFEGHFLAIEMVGLAGLLRFTALFPRRLLASEVKASATVPAALMPAHLLSVAMLWPAAPWLAGALILGGLWTITIVSGGTVSDAGLSPLMDVVRLATAGLVVLNLRRAWGRADDGGRERLRWLIVGFTLLIGSLALMIGGNVLVAVTGFPEPNVAWRPLLLDMGLVGFLSGLALSVLYGGPILPMAVLRRTATLAAVVTIGLFLAAGLEALLSGGVLATFRVRSGVGTALALATMVSTYRGLVRFVERMMPPA